MGSNIRDVFSFPYALFFLKLKNHSLNFFAIFCHLFPLSPLLLIWGFIRIKINPERSPIVLISETLTEIISSITISAFGLYHRKELSKFIINIDHGFKIIQQKFNTKFDITNMRRVANFSAAIHIAMTVAMIMVELYDLRNDFEIHPRYWFQYMLFFVENLVAWYYGLWMMLASVVDCCLTEILANQLSILISKFKLVPEFNVVSMLIFENVSNLNNIFGLSRLLILSAHFFTITIGLWVYVSADILNLDLYLYYTGLGVCIIFAIVTTGKRVFENVGIRCTPELQTMVVILKN